MSEEKPPFDIFDPTGMLKSLRGQSMDAWSKMMVQFVNTDEYAEATASALNTWLTSSTPFRKAMEKGMAEALASLNMPTRAELTTLAGRLTNIEMRLDDMDGKMDELLRLVGKTRKTKAGGAKPKS